MAGNLLLADVVTRARALAPDAPALVEAGRTLSWAALEDRVARLAALFRATGMREGDRLALLAPNCAGFLETLLAASLVGATVVPLNTRLIGPEVRFQVEDAGAAYAVVHPDLDALAADGGLTDLACWRLGDDLDALLARQDPVPGPRPSADPVLVQLYTSGTTGRPKGCLLPQSAWLAATASLAHHFATTDRDVVMTTLPFFHVGGLGFALSGLIAGAPVVLPSAGDELAALERHRVTVAGIPFHLAPLAKHPRVEEVGASLRAVLGHTVARSIGALPHVEVWNGYGMTESCGLVVMAKAGPEVRRDGLLGRPLLHVDAAIVDDRGSVLPAGQEGEIVLRAPSVTTGYWGLPEASQETLAGGWLHTGDLGRRDEAGDLYFLDRAKDMVKPGGENVYSAEIEGVVLQHPAVADCAVIGVPDRRWGEAVKAVVVFRRGVEPDFADLDRWCLDRLAPYKRPRWYEASSQLPRNHSGKVLKTQLRESHDAGRATRLGERS